MPTPPTPAEMFLAMTEALAAPKGQMAKVLVESLDEIQAFTGTADLRHVNKENEERLVGKDGEEE